MEAVREGAQFRQEGRVSKKLEGNTVYLIERTNGEEIRLTVPSAWKVTFGPAAPPRKDGYAASYGAGRFALRFYEAENKQRAIFTDVCGFRDLSLAMEKKVKRVEESSSSYKSEKGSNAAQAIEIEEAWVAA